jgi:gliding motility-associated-like protein
VGSNDDSADHLLSESESHEFTKVWDAEGNYTLLAKDQQNHVLASKEILIQKLNASFQYNMRMYPEIAFNAQSNDPEAELTWQFGDEEAAVGKEVIHRFAVPRDSQNYQVKLIAWTSAGCKTECQLPLTLYAANEPIIPNVFTPDGDRLNDKFEIMMQGNKFIALQILNQDQQLIFETKDMNQPWDGMIGGKPAERGTYYYRLIYQTATNDKPTIVSNTLFLQRGN